MTINSIESNPEFEELDRFEGVRIYCVPVQALGWLLSRRRDSRVDVLELARVDQ
jgi:hypothetical protein